ncbi:Transposase, IS605 OrfB [Geobacillus thermoleovorans CCB_US3_UF5]|uniref:Transposase, IS605 OrfB n=2 Tax=Geobacillus thermoleovorans group TaxID=1505648 RepID=U2WNK2_GEOKU|nr:Transposase, IS605 OrfB [Geobacillus thermoleovorans CCB_US3_UF5]KDE46879.1 transposase [Geobacillus sp. CAMR12739]GAD12316.1 transposase, IS605 OrfB [Geobacillus kaustophilus GBlys]GAJ58307.1 transposase [Geobacillus thermoleovorans B23]
MKSLDIRQWMCPNGGAEHDRDHNAARTILQEGLRLLFW